jgi:hypothetical protein
MTFFLTISSRAFVAFSSSILLVSSALYLGSV